MSKKKKIKRLERENADLRERLKYIEGYFAAADVVIKTFNVKKSINNKGGSLQSDK